MLLETKVKKDVQNGRQTFCVTVDKRFGLKMMGPERLISFTETDLRHTSLMDFFLRIIEFDKTKAEKTDEFQETNLTIFPKLPYKLMKQNYSSDEARNTLRDVLNILGWRNGGYSYKDKDHVPPGWPTALNYDNFEGPHFASIEEAMMILKGIFLYHNYDPDQHVKMDHGNYDPDKHVKMDHDNCDPDKHVMMDHDIYSYEQRSNSEMLPADLFINDTEMLSAEHEEQLHNKNLSIEKQAQISISPQPIIENTDFSNSIAAIVQLNPNVNVDFLENYIQITSAAQQQKYHTKFTKYYNKLCKINQDLDKLEDEREFKRFKDLYLKKLLREQYLRNKLLHIGALLNNYDMAEPETHVLDILEEIKDPRETIFYVKYEI